MGERVLVSTLPLWPGGVLSMVRFALECLEREGLEPVLAYYLPYSIDPSLSVRLPGLLMGRRPLMRQRTRFGHYEAHELGASLPELEHRHHKLNASWQRLIDGCRYHMAVSGSCLAARPFVDAGIPFLLWAATPWMEDRAQRYQAWPFHRRVFDRLVVQPRCRREEVRILRAARSAFTISDYCRRQLVSLVPEREIGVVPVPVDASRFLPNPQVVVPGRVGFVGRITDPRKNVLLFLQALAAGRAAGTNLTGLLVGGELPPEGRALVESAGLGEHVSVIPSASPESLPGLLASMDVFFVPSRQEGLCIAALEAMASGCPVVSTRCGGPEDFVLDGETGYLTSFRAEEAGAILARVVSDRALRLNLSRKARRLIEARYDRGSVQARMRMHVREGLLGGMAGTSSTRPSVAPREKGVASG